MGVGHRDRQADPDHGRQVNQVIADIGHLPGGEPQFGDQPGQPRAFVLFVLIDIFDTQRGHAFGDNPG